MTISSTRDAGLSHRRLREALAGTDPLLDEALAAPAALDPDPDPGPAQLAAAGPRAEGRRDDYELLVEMIHEGYRLHYDRCGAVVRPQDSDLALLLGDQLYALGLARLVELGDLDAVGELADVISLAAQAQAAGDPQAAAAVWEAGATAVGWGGEEGHRRAKQLARADAADAADALRAAARAARARSAPEN